MDKKDTQPSPTVRFPQEGIPGEAEIVPPQDTIQLTFDREEMLRQIESSPGFTRLTVEQQEMLRERILSTVPLPPLPPPPIR